MQNTTSRALGSPSWRCTPVQGPCYGGPKLSGVCSILAASGSLFFGVCGVYEKLWYRALRIAQPKVFNVNQTQQVDFPRFDAYHAKMPPMANRSPCRCGGGEAWSHWHKVKMAELLGEGRR